MPKDNHSMMQLYLDGFKNNFFTFFSCKEKNSDQLNSKIFLPSHKYLKFYSSNKIILKQKKLQRLSFLKKIFRLEVLKLTKEMKRLWENYFATLY